MLPKLISAKTKRNKLIHKNKMTSARNFFSAAEQEEIIKTIHLAEELTSGEMKVHLEEHCGVDAFKRAVEVFQKLQLQKTQLRNAVLFYIAVKDHQFAIVADEGINKKVPDGFWDEVKEGMQIEFSKNRFYYGIIQAIEQTGEQLKQYFPLSQNDRNELSNEISFM